MGQKGSIQNQHVGGCQLDRMAFQLDILLVGLGDLIEEKRNLTGFIESGMRLFGMGKG